MVKLVNHAEDTDASPQLKPLNPFLEEQFDRLHTYELVKNICRRLDTYVGDEFIEDIMYDTFDMTDTTAENWFKAAYPPSEMSTSSFTILRQPTLDSKCRTIKSKNSPESFLKIVANAYSGIHRQDGMSTKLQCNLISQQPDTDNMIVHSFEFENEIEYWTFVGEIKRTIADFHSGTKHEDAHQTGYCQYLPTSNHNTDPVTPSTDGSGTYTPQPHRKSGGGAPPPSGFFGGLFSGQKDSGAKTHRWEINGQSLVIIDTHSQYRVGVAVGAITESILGAFNLQELVALTLSVDYAAPAAALLVASLAHAERDRSKEKENDATGICTSTAYNELVLDVSLKRIINAPSDGPDGKEVRKEMEYLPSTIYRRGIGEITVLTLSEQDIVQCEMGDGTTTTAESALSPPPSTANSPLGASSLSPKNTKVKGIAKASSAPLFFHNLLEVVIHERSDTESVVGTQIVSLGDLTRTEAGTESEYPEVALDVDAAKTTTHKASSSIFGSFMRRDKESTPMSATESESAYSVNSPATAKSPTNGSRPSMMGNATRPPLPRPAPSGAGGASNSSVVLKDTRDIKYYEPVFRDVDITLKANSKAARLVIKSASSLPSSSAALEAKKIPPTVYATVYLVDAKGEKRSVNSVDSRTEAIKSFDPEWNKEVLLQNEHTGVDDITTVMVLLRDASVGILKHHHIGRVNIPISCFLDNTQADFCLPLEATYRMNEEDEHFHLGDVHFTTELIDVGPDRKRIKSLVRTASQNPNRNSINNGERDPSNSPNGSSERTPVPTPNGVPNKGANAGMDSASTTPGIAETASAPTRRMTVIGATPSASGPRSNKNVAAVRYCLYRATAGAVWWPVRLLKTTLLSSPAPATAATTTAGNVSSAEKAGVIAAPRKSSASQLFNQSSNGYGVRSDSVGFIWCGFRAVLIELTPGVTGVLYNCQECEDNVLVVGWHNVVDCLDVSEASMLLTLRINTCTSNASQISRQEMFYAPAIISLLVGPCQAAALRRECQQRAQFNYIRENIAELTNAVAAFTSSGNNANGKMRSFNMNRANSPPQSPSNTGKSGYVHAPSGVANPTAPVTTTNTTPTLSQVLAANVSTFSMAQSTVSVPTIPDILSMARAAATALEGIIQHCEALLNKSLLLSLDGNKPITSAARGVLTPTLLQLNPPVYNGFTADVSNPKKTVLPAYSPIVKDRQSLVRTIARAKVYFAYLRHVCGKLTTMPHDSMDLSTSGGSFTLPEFSAEAIQRYVKQDCENVQLFTPLRTGAKIETMVSRFEGFLEAALERVRDYVIFSGGVWEPKRVNLTVEVPTVRAKSRGSGSNQPFFAETGRNDISGKECVQMLLEAYHQTILNYLKPYVGNKDAFRKISGQDIKNIILKLIIENNFRFELSSQLAVGAALDMKITPSLPLVEDINTVLEWYSDSLLHDTRSWLIRTLQNANTDRKNRSNLPWDVEMIGDKMVSFLPETLRFQLNVYTEICSVQLTSGATDGSNNKAVEALEMNGTIGLGMSMPSGMQVHPTVPVAHALSQAVITERVNEMILHAVSEALVLLAEEYTRALQGRHWDRPDPTTGKLTVHRDFLAAIANDCHRVLTVHVPELQETVHTSTLVHNAKKLGLVEAFGEPADIALRQIMRIVFTDVHSTLIDYDTLWQNPKNLAARTICVAVSAHLRSLQNILCADLFFKLVGSCAQVIVLRMLLFLKMRSGSKHPFSHDDVSRFLRDVAQVKQCFLAFVTDADNGGYSLDSDTILPTTQGEIVNNLEDITHGVAAGKFITHSAFEALDILCHLLSQDYDTAEFHRLALGVVEKYDNIPASVNADGSKFKEKDSQQADYNTVPNAVLLGCVAHLRTDASPELTSFLNAILVSHEHSHSNAMGGASHRTYSPLVDSPALTYDVFVRIFGASFGFSSINGSGMQETKHGLKGLLSPGATIKHWREKAADIAVKKGPTMVSAVKTRQNEETAMDLMRTLGLEVQSRSKEDREGAKDNTTAARRGSGRDWQAQLQAQTAAPTPASGSLQDTGALSRSLNTELSGENTPASVADKTEKHKKKKGIFGMRTAKNDDDSSSDSDTDTVSTPQCLIQIGEIQVRALHSSSFIGGPNPYVYFSVNGRKRVKTAVKWDHKEAAWSETYELPADLQTIQDGRITIKVFDKERMRRKRLMGTVTVRLAPLEFHSFESWYALEGGEHGNYGEVHCRLRMINDTSHL